jgi:hypothetical protein
VIVWIIWLLVTGVTFAVLEILGLMHKGPTLSQVWKRWEDGGPQVKGVVKWTLFRWFTLFGLVGLSTYLVIHWVAEAV